MFKFIDLFSGIGGFRIAFEDNGGTCVFSSEIDKYARETYKDNFGEYPSGDITKIPTEEIPEHDILCAGFPCQPFSIAGKRLGFQDSRGTLFFNIAKILKEKRPKAFLLENVSGLISHDKGRTLKKIEEIIQDLGYDYRYKVMNSLKYGIPQNRSRWYCVGFNKDLNISFEDEMDEVKDDSIIFKFPKEKELDYFIEDILDKKVKGYEATERAMENITANFPKFKHKNRIDNKRLIIANNIRPSRCSFRNDGISPCLTAKMGTGGNNIPVIFNYSRKLTERECLRLMGFPREFKIKAKHYQSYKQIGNSVAVPIIHILAKEMIYVLSKKV